MELHAAITAVRDGERERYHDVVMTTQGAVRRFLAARLAAIPEVEELLQATFVTAYSKLATYDPQRGQFSSWLIGIAHNHLRHHLRSRARNQEIGIDGLDAMIAAELESDPDEHAEQRLQALRVCLDRLPPRSRAILQHRYTSDEGLAKMAQRYHQGQQALASLLLRLRRTLRTCIEGQAS